MDELDRILAAEDGIEPSSGFADTVKRAIATEAEDRALPLPWGRWALGMAACLVLAAAGAVLLLPAVQAARVALQPLAASSWPLAYAAIAVAGSLAVAAFPAWRRRFAG
jgi:hypothetical protein